MKTKTIKINYLARVEGEGALDVRIKDDDVQHVKLKIFEPPRFFEAFLIGRKYNEVPDITSRICGICPVAHQLTTSHALENAFGQAVDGQLRALRRLLYCGQYIESHALHIFLLHAPDFLGYDDAIRMSKDHADTVKTGLELKKYGNELLTLLGGREIHPVNGCVGGFYKLPEKEDLTKISDKLKKGRDKAYETVQWLSGLDFPGLEQDYEYVCLSHPDEYALCEGNIISSKGVNIPIDEYEQNFIESHVPYSTSLQSKIDDKRTFFVGPMARYNLNFDQLSSLTKKAAKSAKIEPPCNNPFKSIIIRAMEMLYAFDEAVRLIDGYRKPDRASIEIKPRAGTGYGCTEAPRGLLYHRFSVNENGVITGAKIVTPTAQNQIIIEDDLRKFISKHIKMNEEELQWKCEQIIRNYDPCISCSVHYLKLKINRE
ncbi:Ni/Fe hydrogenase subunit alpha [candidate division KSB1 bacterium]